MNFPPLPPVSPIPPRDGEFARVRRRALVRRLRIPAAAVASGALAAVALASVSSPQATGRVQQVTDDPTQVERTYDPTPYPTVAPTPSPVPTPYDTSPAPDVSEPPEPADPTPTPTSSPPPDPLCGPDGPRTSGPYVSGIVVDAAGKPLPGITITAEVCKDGITYDGAAADVTDSAGRFRYPCAKDHWAIAAPFEYYTGTRSTSLDVGYRWFNGTFGAVPCGSDHRIVLPEGAAVFGRLVDAAGNPVARAGQWVAIMSEDDEATGLVTVKTDAEGEIRFDGLAPGRYFLYAGHSYSWFTVTEGGHAEVDVKEATPSPSPSGTEPAPEPTAAPTSTTQS